MRAISLGLFLFVFSFVYAADRAAPSGQILIAGPFTAGGRENILKTPETPSGKTRTAEADGRITFLAETNRIAAEITGRFGFAYAVTNLNLPDGEIKITKKVVHPALTRPDGKSSTNFVFQESLSIKSGGGIGVTGYGFDHQYELVAGNWDFELSFQGTTLCTQRFEVFLPKSKSRRSL